MNVCFKVLGKVVKCLMKTNMMKEKKMSMGMKMEKKEILR
jgi:hypothetical protein